uniref:Uncharacterized protein n=1 Tax=viral metagenome TaxID=1070528 RepID=A0A6C0JJW2_9ZZZZ
MKLCACYTNEGVGLGTRCQDIWDELVELFEVETVDEFLDEWSDVVYGIGRLIGWFWGVEYVGVYGDARHIKKIEGRMREHGCIRSRRHLIDGKCCSLCN